MRDLKLIYISSGNIPSRWAHSFQVMKMAEALAAETEAFTLVTGGSVYPGSNRFDLQNWYSVRRPFRIARLPIYFRRDAQSLTVPEYKRFAVAAAAYARIQSPDLVYARAVPAGVRTVRMKLRTIVETHSFPEHPEFQSMAGIYENKYLVGVVTVTEYLKQKYVKAGLPEKKVFICPDAVDLEHFLEFPPAETLREELGLPSDRPVATYCGHFYQHKGVEFILDAAERMPDVYFCLIGGWPEDIDRMKKRAGGAGNVLFTGFVPNSLVPRYLHASDFLLLPNSMKFEEAYSTSPLKLFEYMAARRPIIASDVPAFRSVLSHNVNAFLVQPDSSDAIEAAIRSLDQEPSLKARLAETAWRDVQKYTWTRRAKEILDHFLPEYSHD